MSELPEGWIKHDGGPCPLMPFAQPMASYRRNPNERVKLFAAGMERWEWRGKTRCPLDIIAYKPEAPMTENERLNTEQAG